MAKLPSITKGLQCKILGRLRLFMRPFSFSLPYFPAQKKVILWIVLALDMFLLGWLPVGGLASFLTLQSSP